jgi:hypothetical protein
LLLQAFYSIRSERQLMEQMDYNLLFRWFVGLAMDAPIWDVTVFTKNRERLLSGDVAAKLLSAIINQPRVQALLSDDHFSVDGTLIEAWASAKASDPRMKAAPEMTMTPGWLPAAASRQQRRPTVMPNAIFAARSAAMQPMHRPQILMPDYSRRRAARQRSCATWAMS